MPPKPHTPDGPIISNAAGIAITCERDTAIIATIKRVFGVAYSESHRIRTREEGHSKEHLAHKSSMIHVWPDS
eukprot:3347224-Amphidinium_carterae.1